MSLNIGPEKIVRTRSNGRGGYNSEVYTLSAWLNGGCLGILVFFALCIAVAPIAGFLLLIYYCFEKENEWFSAAVPLLFSVYEIIDIKKHWIIYDTVSIFYGSGGSTFSLKMSITTILVSTLFLISGNWWYKFSNENKWLFLFAMILLFRGGYLLVGSFF